MHTVGQLRQSSLDMDSIVQLVRSKLLTMIIMAIDINAVMIIALNYTFTTRIYTEL